MSIHRTDIQKIENRKYTRELMRKGYRSPEKIAKLINNNQWDATYIEVTANMVAGDMEAIKMELAENSEEDRKSFRNQMIEIVFNLMEEYDEAYQLSKKNEIIAELQEVQDQDAFNDRMQTGLRITSSDDLFLRDVKIRERTRPEGNPVFLNGKFKCIEELNKIMGTHAPDKMAFTNSEGEDVESPLREIESMLVNLEPKKEEPKLLNE